MLPLWITVLLLVGALVVLVGQGFAIALAYLMPRLDPDPPSTSGPTPSLCVVIAARNEVNDLPATLDDLQRQDLPAVEIIVVDGGSTDGTLAEIDRRAHRVHRIDEPPLPPGWVGKSWACWTGARATQSEWLLFMDADVRTDPAALRTALASAVRERADLSTLGPRIEMGSFWERTVMPFYIQMVLTYFRTPFVNRPGSHRTMANGQFLLVRREAYEAAGGHKSIRGYILEDVALARRFRALGFTIRAAWAPGLASTRMYRERRELFEGPEKNIHGLEYSVARQVGFLAGLIGLFLLPLGLLSLGLALLADPALMGVGGVLYVALFGKHVAFARALGAPGRYGLLFPIAVGFYVALVTRSLGRSAREEVSWKGRSYARDPGAPLPKP